MSTGDEQIILKSGDDREFKVSRKAALASGTIRDMIAGPGAFVDTTKGVIHLKEISTPVLKKVVEYLEYHAKYHGSTAEPPDFIIEPEVALDLLMAANFLDV